MIKYILPIFYTLYNYIFTKLAIPLIFIGIMGIVWISGYDFIRSLQTVYIVIVSIIGSIILYHWKPILIWCAADESEADELWEDFKKNYYKQKDKK